MMQFRATFIPRSNLLTAYVDQLVARVERFMRINGLLTQWHVIKV